jgi:hypothetical protein
MIRLTICFRETMSNAFISNRRGNQCASSMHTFLPSHPSAQLEFIRDPALGTTITVCLADIIDKENILRGSYSNDFYAL